ncbi:hypothetical protein QBC34DRAFT_377913 [Podospora aff. communis PSN243]|uniref:Increased recombination centers protein 6 n=1 Tax=Podospora aff. communis PSN243 TaxID=3040156 RepID=A0AAV9GWX5_9PEZI|nr:hypothetical protein QBC34DRAFT_377913 [Podospora aff. communis PSN243]
MEISNPRRILAVSLTESTEHLSRVIKDLSGTHPQPSNPQEPSSLAGVTHHLPLSTQYYTASVPVWLDVVSSPGEWADSFLAPEAKEVLDVLGGLLLVFNVGGSHASGSSSVAEGKAKTKEFISHVGRVVRQGLGGWEWDGVLLAVGVGDLSKGEEGEEEMDEWEDVCTEWGLEFVHVSGTAVKGEEGRNEFGERMGVARALEALQANDWGGGGGGEEGGEEFGGFVPREDEDLGEFDPESMDFGFDREDFVGLRKAIWSAGREDGMDVDGGEGSEVKKGGDEDEEMDDGDVQKLERIMLKLQAVRDRTAGMSEEQRKRIAKQAVGEVMKEL